ncbi:hypothetical protein AAF712_003464 [Marasmius tenuissimus]|uniref:Uncharacterized protein n=1 Tax=Marasmius tenuissimus TaxID=585030 RepID=A0ABR3A7U6_9AGAR
MVRISIAVVVAALASTVASLTQVEQVLLDVDDLRQNYFPVLAGAIDKIPNSPEELKICSVVASPRDGAFPHGMQAAATRVAGQSGKINSGVANTTNLSYIEAGQILCYFQDAHHDLMAIVNGIVAKNATLTGDKAFLRAPLRAQLSDMRAGHDVLTKTFRDKCPDFWKEKAGELNADGDAQFAVAESSFDPLK